MTNGESDPTRIRNQPSLSASSGRVWLIVGGLFAIIAAALLWSMRGLPPVGVGVSGTLLVTVLYALMVLSRLLVPEGRRRLGLMASLMLAMALVALVCVLIVAASAAEQLAP